MLGILISLFGKGFIKNAFNSEKINFDIKLDGLPKTFPFPDIYPSSKKLSKIRHFVSPWAPSSLNGLFFKEQY